MPIAELRIYHSKFYNRVISSVEQIFIVIVTMLNSVDTVVAKNWSLPHSILQFSEDMSKMSQVLEDQSSSLCLGKL